jgi:hypothetical protein
VQVALERLAHARTAFAATSARATSGRPGVRPAVSRKICVGVEADPQLGQAIDDRPQRVRRSP